MPLRENTKTILHPLSVQDSTYNKNYNLNAYRYTTEYIFYCKRAILFLSSSKILTPHPPLRPASVYPPPLLRGEDRLAGRRGGLGVNILEDDRNRIALLQ